MPASPKMTRNFERFHQDQMLVEGCLHGEPEAWSALVDKYKNLIFSIPVKQGFSADEAADIFQTVCLTLISELPRLREPRALPAWLIQTTAHKCFRWRNEGQRYVDMSAREEMLPGEPSKIPETLVAELEREQILRNAVAELSQDCRRMVELLFYRVPSPSYDDIATALQIPKGSIGPTRMRCLEKLKRSLEKNGF
jgi:RNA polymerase sigma factor (sigma-70 family)